VTSGGDTVGTRAKPEGSTLGFLRLAAREPQRLGVGGAARGGHRLLHQPRLLPGSGTPPGPSAARSPAAPPGSTTTRSSRDFGVAERTSSQHLLPKSAMVSISHAIEDECAARSAHARCGTQLPAISALHAPPQRPSGATPSTIETSGQLAPFPREAADARPSPTAADRIRTRAWGGARLGTAGLTAARSRSSRCRTLFGRFQTDQSAGGVHQPSASGTTERAGLGVLRRFGS
jgi:hypothetical protein